MDYHVILIEYGKPTHHWYYDDISLAVQQLNRLLIAYEEVNEVCPTLIKAGFSDRNLNPYELLQRQVISPDRSNLA